MGNACKMVENNRKKKHKGMLKLELLQESVNLLKDYIRIQLVFCRAAREPMDTLLIGEKKFNEFVHYSLVQIHHNLIFLEYVTLHVRSKKKTKPPLSHFQKQIEYYNRIPLVSNITIDDESLVCFVQGVLSDVMNCRYIYGLEIYKVLRQFPLPLCLVNVITILCCNTRGLQENVISPSLP